MTTILRPYQLQAVTAVRRHAAAGGKGAVLQMPTGAGKTACFSNILAGAYAKGRCGMMVVRGKALVHQASERLTREGIPHGIYQGAATSGTHHLITLASIDTLFRRKVTPEADILVFDECHLTHSEGYAWLLSQPCYEKSFRLGVSATPHHKKGMRHIGDVLIRPVDIKELIEQGYLVGARYYVPYVPDLSGVAKTNGDFNVQELSKRSVDDTELTGNAAKVWSTHLRGKSTLVYASSVEHAQVIAGALQASGARTATITAKTDDHSRGLLIAGLTTGEIDALVSVGVLTTGVDIPPLQAILCCRPTESYNLWIQILGRGTRPYPGKTHFEVYDLSGNIFKHGRIETEPTADLDGIEARKKQALWFCPACFATGAADDLDEKVCPQCGATLQSKSTGSRSEPLVGLGGATEVREVKEEPWEGELPALVELAKLKQLKKGWIYHQIRSKHGEAAADAAWAKVKRMKRWPTKEREPVPMPSSYPRY